MTEEAEKNDELLAKERKDKLIKIVKEKKDWIAYILLAAVVYVAVYIRTLPMRINPSTGHPGLWDITKNTWTLGPDLDPFLFLRWAKHIVANGHLMAVDTMRYVPLGFNTQNELYYLPMMIAWFHKITTWFGNSSVEYSAVLFPAVMFGLSVIVFFLFVRKVFVDELGSGRANVIALIASFLLSVIPTFIPRTIAGIPEKESAGIFFLFLAFYFVVAAWKSKKLSGRAILAVLAGLATAGMASVWGGYVYAVLAIGLAGFFAFILQKIDKPRFIVYAIWVVASYLTIPLVSRSTYIDLINSTTTSMPLIVLFIMAVDFAIVRMNLVHKPFFEKNLKKYPGQVISLTIALIAAIILVAIVLGPDAILHNVNDFKGTMIQPITDRLGVTVAENKQPYFTEWAGEFGPYFGKIPLLFSLLMIGSVVLYWSFFRKFKTADRIILTAGYVIFLFGLVFSRYSSNSTLNGINSTSIGLYIFGALALVGTFIYCYLKEYRKQGSELFSEVDLGELVIFAFFFLALVSARSAIRLTMMVVPPASIMAAYLVVIAISSAAKKNEPSQSKKWAMWIIAGIVVLAAASSGYQYYLAAQAIAQNNVPSVYTQQWQKAMAWVRENTPQNAVFAHWWDYGYWVQSIGERATVLDGGNAYPYWDYLMGRYGLTNVNDAETAQFLYSHNVTHFLIDSTDIGKYSAFSSIGSDENYDRASYIPTLHKDSQYTQELKNSTKFVYTGGVSLDQDIVYMLNDTRVFLPAGSAGMGAIILERDSLGKLTTQPQAVYVYQQKQYTLPLRYAYDDGSFKDFGSGVEAGIFIYPKLVQLSSGYGIDETGALLYLSNKTVKSQLARHYLYKANDSFWKLVHTEDDVIVAQLKAQNQNYSSDFVEFNGFRGPIRIWEIHYPEGVSVNKEYLETKYPNVALSRARQ